MPQYIYPEDFEGTFWTIIDGAFYVSTIGNDITGDGSPKNPFLTVEHAFSMAADGERIIIGPDEYVSFKPSDISPSGAVVPCRVATPGDINLGIGGGGIIEVDGIQTQAGDRVLVWRQADPTENGIYVVGAGLWERADDFNEINSVVSGKLIPVLQGNENGTTTFQHTTTGTIQVGVTQITIEKATATDWGEIRGTLSNQSDLNTALGLKANVADLNTHISDTNNPHAVSKADVGLGNVDNTSDSDKPVSTAQQNALDLKADRNNVLELDNTSAYVPSADHHPTTKRFVEDQIAALDKATPKGLIDASANPHYPVGEVGDYYYVSVEGKIGGAQGPTVQVGDKIQCIIDDPTGGTQGTVGNRWIIFQGNLDKATASEAALGDDNEKYLTPLRGREGWENWVSNRILSELGTIDKTVTGAINELQASSGNVFKVGVPVADQLAVWNGDGVLAGTQYLLLEEDQLKTAFDVTVGTDGGEGDGTLYLTRTSNGFAAIDFGESWSLRTYAGPGEGAEFGVFNANSGENVIFIESGNRITISDADGGLGAQYAGDYSSGNSANSRWIPDKGYVDNAIAGIVLPSNNFVTAVSFNTGNGQLSLTRNGLSSVSTNLDGRYLRFNQIISLSGQLSGSGSTTINAALTVAAIAGQTALGSGLAAADELLVNDNGVLKRMDISVLASYMQANLNFGSDANNFVTGISFNTGNGNLTVNRSGLSTLTENLDGRYLTGNQSISLSGQLSGSGTTGIAASLTAQAITAQTALTSGLASSDELLVSDNGSLKRMDVSVIQSYMQSNLNFGADANNFVSSATFNTTNGVLTLNRSGLSAVAVDLDGRYFQTGSSLSLGGQLSGSSSNAELHVSAISAQPALSSLQLADELLVNDNGVLKRIDVSVLLAFMQDNLDFDPPEPIPSAPTSANASIPNNSGSVSLSWTQTSNNETGFRVERRINGGSWSFLRNVAANVTSTTDTVSQQDGLTYQFRVRAFNASGASAFATSNIATVSITPTPPAAPSNAFANQALFGPPADYAIGLSWTQNSNNEDGFRIERRVNAGLWVFVQNTSQDATVANDLITVSGGGSYQFRVRSFNSAGTSAWVNSNTILLTSDIM